MLPSNHQIDLTAEEAIDILKEIEIILISLHNIGSFYSENHGTEYAIETCKFIDDWHITTRLAKVRKTISEKFDTTLGDDDMDDIERAMKNISIWEPKK